MAGEGIPGLADKLNHLFATVPRAGGSSQRHTNDSAAEALEECGIRVSGTHLSHLRAARRDNPSAKLISGLAQLFGVPIAYFFDEGLEHEVNQQLATLVAMRDARCASQEPDDARARCQPRQHGTDRRYSRPNPATRRA